MSNLEGLQFFADHTLEDIILKNVKEFISYGLLEVGAFYNIPIGQQNHLGHDISRLTPITGVPHIVPNTIYQGAKNDWVWEQNIAFKYSGGSSPLLPSGIVVNSTFYPTGTPVGSNSYYIDYNRGRVVFTSPLAQSGVVQAAHSERIVQIYELDGPEYRQIDDSWHNYQASSGTDTFLYQAYLPAIFVGVDNYKSVPRELGGRSKITFAKLHFDVIGNSNTEIRRITDMLYFMEAKGMRMFNPQTAGKPLNYRGERVSGHIDYLYKVTNFFTTTSRFKENASVIKIRNSQIPLHRAVVLIDLEIDTAPI